MIPPVIPKRRNNRLKCALTVRRAIFNCLAISALSQPCSSSSTICCSRGPSRTVCSLIDPPLSIWNPLRCGALVISRIHSTHNATLRQTQDPNEKTLFHSHLPFMSRYVELRRPYKNWVKCLSGLRPTTLDQRHNLHSRCLFPKSHAAFFTSVLLKKPKTTLLANPSQRADRFPVPYVPTLSLRG